ncbi:MAG: DinB family protein [Dehalococcoidia bacterium]|nr:DinB family protein [Dehalococcoidia bacterium]
MRKVERYLADADAAIDELCTALADVDATKWAIPEAEGEWSVKQTLAHISANTRFHVELAQRFLAGEAGPPTKGGPTTRQPWHDERDAALAAGPAAILAWIRRDHAAHRAAILAIADDQLAVNGQSAVGAISVEYLLRRLGARPRQHLRQAQRIRRTTGA